MTKGEKSKSRLLKYMDSLDEDDSEFDEEFLDDNSSINQKNTNSRLLKYMDSLNNFDDDSDKEKVLNEDINIGKVKFNEDDPKSRLLKYVDSIDKNHQQKPKKTSKVTTLDEYFYKDNSSNVSDDNYSLENQNLNLGFCIVCGKKLPKNNFSDKCDECISKLDLMSDLKELLNFVSPKEPFTEGYLIEKGYQVLKLNILTSKLIDERLLGFDLEGRLSLASVKTLNRFFSKYGSADDLLDETNYDNFKYSDEIIDISKFSEFVKVRFDTKFDRWVVKFYFNNKFASQKKFIHSEEAYKEAIKYLKQLGEINISKIEEPKYNKSKYSKHEGIYYSPDKKKWGAKVKGFKGFKFLGHFDTEEEAFLARKKYLDDKENVKNKFISRKLGIKATKLSDNSDDQIYFSKQSGNWIVRLKDHEGKFFTLGRFDSEEEAKAAKEEYINSNLLY